MPTYTYRCKSCGNEFEELQRISEDRLLRCPSCGKDALMRIIGGGAGLMFKGSGFYQTDYKKSNSSAAPKTSEKKESALNESSRQPAGKEKKAETKTEPPKESKTKPDKQ